MKLSLFLSFFYLFIFVNSLHGQDHCKRILSQVVLKKSQAQIASEKLLEEDSLNNAKNLYGHRKWQEIHNSFVGIREDFTDLISDIALGIRIDDFAKWYFKNSHEQKLLDPWEVRNNFSKFLGKRKVIRAMALTDQEVKEIKLNGISSYAKREGKDFHKSFNARDFSLHISSHIGGKRTSDDLPSILISVSEIEEIALTIGKSFIDKKNKKELRLIEIEVPELDIIHQDGIFDIGNIVNSNQEVIVGPNIYPRNRKVESFIVWNIAPESIVSIKNKNIKYNPEVDLTETYKGRSKTFTYLLYYLNKLRP